MDKIFFRADSSNTIGAGHIYRCINLARFLKKKYKIVFICRELKGNLIHKIKSEKFEVYKNKQKISFSHPKIWSKKNQLDDAKFIKQKIKKKYKLIISDHYGLGKIWGKKIKDTFKKHLAIDDLKYFNKACDYYLNYNFPKRLLISKVKNVKYFCGENYILNGHKIFFKKKKKSKQSKKLLVFFGSVDRKNFSKSSYDFFKELDYKNLKVDILVGINHKFKKKFLKIKKRENLRFIFNRVENFNKFYKAYDLVLSAANTTMYEQIKAGFKPFVIAQNNDQIKIIQNLEKKKLIKKFNFKIKNEKKIKYLINSHKNFFEKPKSKIALLIKRNSTESVAKKIDKIIKNLK